jgi:hypothetical protein
MPISRVRSSTAVYIVIKTTMKPTTTAMPMTTPMKFLEQADAVNGEQGGEVLHRLDLVAGVL